MTTPPEKDLERIAKLETPEQCEIFERNAIRKARSDLAVGAVSVLWNFERSPTVRVIRLSANVLRRYTPMNES
jgi:hypothetical protein